MLVRYSLGNRNKSYIKVKTDVGPFRKICESLALKNETGSVQLALDYTYTLEVQSWIYIMFELNYWGNV